MCIVYKARLSFPAVCWERGSAVSNTDHMLTLEPKIIFGNTWQKARRSARCVDISLICDFWLESFKAQVVSALFNEQCF